MQWIKFHQIGSINLNNDQPREVKTMINRIHMQDQVQNRIKDITNNRHSENLEELFQNIVTLAIVSTFLLLGLSW
jgi:hypothetical protein